MKEKKENQAEVSGAAVTIPGKYIIPSISFEDSRLTQRKFTILNESLVNLEALMPAWTVYKNKVNAEGEQMQFRDIVPLKPARVIQNEVAVLMQCYMRQATHPDGADETYAEMCETAYKRLVNENPNEYREAIEEMTQDYEALKQAVQDFITSNHSAMLTAMEQNLILGMLNTAKGNKETLTENEKLGAMIGIHAKLYMTRAQISANTLVKTLWINNAPTAQKLPMLKDPKATISIFTIGGSASGKTSSLGKVLEMVQMEHKVSFNDMVLHSLDKSRGVCLQPTISIGPLNTDAVIYDSLTVDEARLLKERELKLISEQSKQEGFRHQLQDSTNIVAKDFLETVKRGGTTIVCLVSTDILTAAERCFKRGVHEGRNVSIGGLMTNHKKAVESLIPALNQEGIAYSNTMVAMYDNNVAPNKPSILFGTINARTKEITIYNEEMLKLWIKKCDLQPIASPKTYEPDKDLTVALYNTSNPKTIDAYFKPLIDRGYTMKIEPIVQQEPGYKSFNA